MRLTDLINGEQFYALSHSGESLTHAQERLERITKEFGPAIVECIANCGAALDDPLEEYKMIMSTLATIDHVIELSTKGKVS